MKSFKLWVHQKGFSEDDLAINPKEFPGVKIGDILEIYHPDEEDSCRLLLQVKSFKDNFQQKEIISIDQSIATQFQLRAYKDVIVTRIDSQDVALDLLELSFKDQYISRSDMWRLKQNMVGACVCISKTIEFSGIRAQVSELWSRGDRVMCGAINVDTRVAFRSSTAMVYMFLQMSSEMWDFDSNGDLYFEKAVNGFLTDLFTRWKEKKANNEVTLVLFSRTYYDVLSIDEFPENMQESIHVDHLNQFYQDFYRVIVMNERREDWMPLLITLKAHFISYPNEVLHVKTKDGKVIKGRNSTAADGNCLEALNLALVVFDKHYINRNFDRTGQLVTIITPGGGVFEVDREMCKITKQRMIDNGIGSDLVCMAEQPLHAVPLFRFHKTMDTQFLGDDYNIPHWLNHSYYTSSHPRQRRSFTSNFTPRIKLADRKHASTDTEPLPKLDWAPPNNNSNQLIPQLDDYVYEAFDTNIFKTSGSPKPRTAASIRPSRSTQSTPYRDRAIQLRNLSPRRTQSAIQPIDIPIKRKSLPVSVGTPSSCAIPIPTRKHAASVSRTTRVQAEETLSHSLDASVPDDHKMDGQPITVGSASAVHDRNSNSPHHQHVKRALINPFAVSSQLVRMTSSRRRWTHTFPQGPTGEIMQLHHQRQTHRENSIGEDQLIRDAGGSLSPDCSQQGAVWSAASNTVAGFSNMHTSASASSLASDGSSGARSTLGAYLRPSNFNLQADQGGRLPGGSSPQEGRSHHPLESRTSWVWGMTGEQEWSPLIQTGVDWKSLTATACFPISTDFFPDNHVLEKEFEESFYELLPDEEARGNQKQTVEGTFLELMSQRLTQGFQLVLVPDSVLSSLHRWRGRQFLVSKPKQNEYILSMGRMFHKLSLRRDQSTILVTMYRPRHPYPGLQKEYSYQLWSALNMGYESSKVNFKTQTLEHFNWNYLDNYISSRGMDFELKEWLKFWRSRFLLLPAQTSNIKRLADETNQHCDIFKEQSAEEASALIEGFLRIMETLNRIRRPIASIRRAKKWFRGLQATLDVGEIKRSPKPKRRKSVTVGTLYIGRLHQQSGDLPRCVPRRRLSVVVQSADESFSVTNRPTNTFGYNQSKINLGSTSGRSTPPNLHVIEGSRSRSGSDADTKGDAKTDGKPNETLCSSLDKPVLTLTTPLRDIAKAMADPSDGIVFLPTDVRNLPTHCFVASEAVAWVMSTLKGEVLECDALELLQNIVEQGFVHHASGSPHIPFINGFFLYVLIVEDHNEKDQIKSKQPTYNSKSSASMLAEHFTEEWFEIAVANCCQPKDIPLFLSSCLMERCVDCVDDELPRSPTWVLKDFETSMKDYVLPKYKNVIMDMSSNKSDRTEWSHINYEACYNPSKALELQAEWLVTTPNLLVEMLQGWARKAVQCGFHLIPAPIDPFNRGVDYHNPLSCPRTIPLHVEDLVTSPSQHLFDQFQRCSRHKRLYLFQEAILKRFGFIPARDSSQTTLSRFQSYEGQCDYVHVSGVAFVFIDGLANEKREPRKLPDSTFPVLQLANYNHSFHSAQKGESASLDTTPQKGVYFSWVYNYLLTKRWRTSSVGDEKLHDRLLADFISFCSNEDGRLGAYWDSVQEIARSNLEEDTKLANGTTNSEEETCYN